MRESEMRGVREAAVAGAFYESSREALVASLRDCFLHELGPGALAQVAAGGPGRVRAVVSPHAGYIYSGPAAALAIAALAEDGVPETAVILGPSHYTSDRRVALSSAAAWRTPLGEVPVDVDLAGQLLKSSDLFEVDEQVHAREHSLEVQLPFLQFVYGERAPKICAVCVRAHPYGAPDDLVADARELGEALAEALRGRRAVVIASTDFSHHLPQELAQSQDRLALEAILNLDPEGLLHTVAEHDISMCGPVPVAIALFAALRQGPCETKLLRHYTSGDVTGDRHSVVGYASLALSTGGDRS